jgi:hypothetical protein
VRKLRLVLPLFVVLLAIPAATAHAVARMPVGFFDDPSFRWSEDARTNLLQAQRAHTSVVHVLAYWASIAKSRPKNPLSGSDPAYDLSDLDQLVINSEEFGMEVLVTIAGTPAWANGGKTPNYPPRNLNDLKSFAQMLARRYNGKNARYGVVTRFSIWNEPNLQLFLAPQFDKTGKIVSAKEYAKLYMAGYKGIKAGNPKALVAAGETSNRGRNKPTGTVISVAPATFAHLLAEANPKLPMDAWATHPYPSVYALGPTQRVAYPNVAFSTMTRFGSDLQKWFGRRIPIWVTEYGEQTVPEYPGPPPGVGYSKQSQDLKKAMQLAQQNPYVEMFTWFIFRDSDSNTWFSGVVKKNGSKKPSYVAFQRAAKNMVGFVQTVPAGKKISVRIPVPSMKFYNSTGTKLGMTYGLLEGKKKLVVAQPLVPLSSDGYVTIKIDYKAAKGKTYTLGVTINDKHGHTVKATVLLLPATAK